MRDYHIKHMEKVITRFVAGLSDNPSYHEKKHYAKYGSKINYVINEINYDIKHGVKGSEVLSFLESINQNQVIINSNNEESLKRLNQIKKIFDVGLMEQT